MAATVIVSPTTVIVGNLTRSCEVALLEPFDLNSQPSEEEIFRIGRNLLVEGWMELGDGIAVCRKPNIFSIEQWCRVSNSGGATMLLYIQCMEIHKRKCVRGTAAGKRIWVVLEPPMSSGLKSSHW